jgi:putative ABC transport system permease protein
MIKNYFKIAWRNMKRHKAYSGINIFGLAIGIAGCLLILQYVSFELSYENFQADQRFGQVFGLFTSLAVLVACMGLFGLASFTTLQRTKEIGIRKVLGASVIGILKLLYREFALLLLVAFLIAAPIAWFTISNWLQGYAFRINIHWVYFVFPFIFMIAIALVTVSYQSIKAVIANPVNSLRME